MKNFIYIVSLLTLLVFTGVSQAEIVYMHNDALGSPMMETNELGAVISRTHYKPFGGTLEETKEGVGYTGHLNDADLGLTYMQARYYDPVIGRFYSNDPLGFRDVHSFNRYAYANNNPYKYVDPTGMNGKKPEQGIETIDQYLKRIRHSHYEGESNESAVDKAKSETPDGDKWNQYREMDGKIEIYRFGRWNSTYDASKDHYVRDFVLGTILSNAGGALGQLGVGAKITFSWPVFIGGAYLGGIYVGITGVNDFKYWRQGIYSENELRAISKYNKGLYFKLGGRDE